MIEHVYRRALRAARVNAIVIATDDERIAAAAESFGAVAVMTARDARVGYRSAGGDRRRRPK